MSTILNAFSTIGQVSAIFTLAGGVIVGLIFAIAGIVIMVRNKSFGLGFLLIGIGVLCILGAFAYYYLVMSSKTVSTIAGVATVANVVIGGRTMATGKS